MNYPDSIPTISNVSKVSLDVFLPELQLLSTELPDEVSRHYLMKAIRHFCRRSNALLRKVSITAQPCVTNYPLPLPKDEQFVRFQTSRIDVATQGNGVTDCGRYQLSWNVPPNQLSLSPTPTTTELVGFLVSTTPVESACEVDYQLYSEYGDIIISGALSEMFLMKGPEVTWTDANLARIHKDRFDRGITSAGIDRITGRSSGPYQMKTRRMI